MVDAKHETKDAKPETKDSRADKMAPKKADGEITPIVITELQPPSAVVGSADMELHVIGSGFTNNAMIAFARMNKQTTFHSDTDVSTIIQPSEATIPPGKASVTIKDGTFESNELEFLFTVPEADSADPLTLTALTPPNAELGSADVVLHAAGTGFTPSSILTFNGGDEPTVFVSDKEVTTIVKPSLATVVGSFPVTVKRGTEETPALMFDFIETIEAGTRRTESRETRNSETRHSKK